MLTNAQGEALVGVAVIAEGLGVQGLDLVAAHAELIRDRHAGVVGSNIILQPATFLQVRNKRGVIARLATVVYPFAVKGARYV